MKRAPANVIIPENQQFISIDNIIVAKRIFNIYMAVCGTLYNGEKSVLQQLNDLCMQSNSSRAVQRMIQEILLYNKWLGESAKMYIEWWKV